MRKHRHFTLDDRFKIEEMLQNCRSARSIAKFLNFSPSSVAREITRGTGFDGEYRATFAEQRYRRNLAIKRKCSA